MNGSSKVNPLPRSVDLCRSDKPNLSHEHSWYVCGTESDIPCYSPNNSTGDACHKACMTWLARRGYQQRGELPPDCYRYDRATDPPVADEGPQA